jgi:hypothetical protein
VTTDHLVVDQARTEEPAPRHHRVIGWLLLVTTGVLLVCSILLGERPTDLASLRSEIAAGDVTEVRLSEGLPAGARGYDTVAIRWEEHGITHVTSVTQASSQRQAHRLERSGQVRGWGQGSSPVVVGDVADALTTDGREVKVVGTTSPYYRGSVTTTAYGFDAPGWIVAVGLGLLGVTLWLLRAREPWRATRWAWAWIILASPIGLLAFVLLGGPLGLLRPRPDGYRLTGGWAFLLAGAVGSAMRSVQLF